MTGTHTLYLAPIESDSNQSPSSPDRSFDFAHDSSLSLVLRDSESDRDDEEGMEVRLTADEAEIPEGLLDEAGDEDHDDIDLPDERIPVDIRRMPRLH